MGFAVCGVVVVVLKQNGLYGCKSVNHLNSLIFLILIQHTLCLKTNKQEKHILKLIMCAITTIMS